MTVPKAGAKAIAPSSPALPQATRGAWIVAAAKKYDIPWEKLWGVYGIETSYGENVSTSSAGAMGGFQFIPSTAKAYGYPETNEQTEAIFAAQADAAAHYLSDLLKQHGGNWDAALKAYSGGGYGEAQVNAAGKGGSIPQHSAVEDGVTKAETAVNDAKKAATAWVSELLEGAGKMALTGGLVAVGLILIVVGIITVAKPAGGLGIPIPVPV